MGAGLAGGGALSPLSASSTRQSPGGKVGKGHTQGMSPHVMHNHKGDLGQYMDLEVSFQEVINRYHSLDVPRGIKARVSHDGSGAAMTAAASLISGSTDVTPGHGEAVAARIRRWYLALQVWMGEVEGGTSCAWGRLRAVHRVPAVRFYVHLPGGRLAMRKACADCSE